MKLYFVTSNPHKIKAAKKLLKDVVDIQSISFELPEIQGDSRSVAIRKAQDAYQKIGEPLIIVDSAFKIKALNDFPDSYANYVEHTLKDDGILKLMKDVDNRSASYVDTLVYIDKYGLEIFENETLGTISKESLQGDFEPFDKIFIKNEDQYPIAYYDKQADTIYENDTYLKLKEFLEKRHVARGITFFDDKVLLLHRIRKENSEYLEYYAIPGGGKEDKETLEDAVVRELKEEASIKVKINSYLGKETYATGVCYYYFTEYQSGSIELGGEEKAQNNPDNFYEIKLIKVSELPKIETLGIAKDMILKAYNIFKDNQNK